LKKHRNTAVQVTAELSIHLSQRPSDMSITNPTSSGTAIAKHLISESNAQMHKQWCMTIKPRHMTTESVM
jgi:hypothetical protein